MEHSIEQLKYLIGKYQSLASIAESDIHAWITQISDLPLRLRTAVSKLSDEQLDTPYREGGWTLRQVVHHLADSHANAYVRFKLAITEDNPTIRPYLEAKWAECQDAKFGGVEVSLKLVEAIHERWVMFLNSLEFVDYDRTYTHPEHNRVFTLKHITGMYAWHCEHHLQHILTTIQRQGWDK